MLLLVANIIVCVVFATATAHGVQHVLMYAPTGTGVVTVSNGVQSGSALAPGASGNVLTSNGSAWVSSTPAAGGGWVTAANVSFAGASDPGLSANGTYTLAGISSVKRENAANDRVAMSTGASGITISPGVSQYTPSAATRTAPLLWFPFSSLGLTSLDLSSSLRVLVRISSSSQSGFDNGHGLIVGIDTDNTSYSQYVKQGTNGGNVRRFTAGVWCGTGNTVSRNDGAGMSTGSVIVEMQVPAIAKARLESLAAWKDSATAWPNVDTLNPVAGVSNDGSPFDAFNASNAALSSVLGVVIAAESPASTNDAYVVTVSDLRVDYRL